MTNSRRSIQSTKPKFSTPLGRSAGEDAFIGPQRFLDDPQTMRGATCVVVLLDGDQNIPILFAEANGIPINPDPNTWDPNALNFKYVDDFMQSPKNSFWASLKPASTKSRAKKSKSSRIAFLHGRQPTCTSPTTIPATALWCVSSPPRKTSIRCCVPSLV
jgi:hypothetical protein